MAKQMKTEVVLVEKGKAIEAHILLNKAGIKTAGAARFKFDFNTAVVTAAATMLACLLAGIFLF
jgi:flavin-dependent dehydrogenase